MASRTELRETGFTLIELMIVVVIIGILAAIAAPKFAEATKLSKAAEAGPILKQIYTLQERHRAAHESYTVVITELEGGSTIATSGTYYTYALAAHPTGYCAVAAPSAEGIAVGISPRSADASGVHYDSVDCS